MNLIQKLIGIITRESDMYEAVSICGVNTDTGVCTVLYAGGFDTHDVKEIQTKQGNHIVRIIIKKPGIVQKRRIPALKRIFEQFKHYDKTFQLMYLVPYRYVDEYKHITYIQ